MQWFEEARIQLTVNHLKLGEAKWNDILLVSHCRSSGSTSRASLYASTCFESSLGNYIELTLGAIAELSHQVFGRENAHGLGRRKQFHLSNGFEDIASRKFVSNGLIGSRKLLGVREKHLRNNAVLLQLEVELRASTDGTRRRITLHPSKGVSGEHSLGRVDVRVLHRVAGGHGLNHSRVGVGRKHNRRHDVWGCTIVFFVIYIYIFLIDTH